MTDQEQGIIQDPEDGYEKATVTIGEPSTRTDHELKGTESKPITAEEFAKNYPILMAEVRATHFKATEFYLINDYKVFPSGTLRPELNRAVENGLITYTTTQIAEPENLALEIDNFIAAPTTKLLNLLDDWRTIAKEKPSRKVSTQTTIDVDGVRQRIELRSLVGSLLGGPVDVVARACQSWLLDLDGEEKESVKRQIHIYLERFEARWGPELDKYDPGLYLQVCMSLGKPQKASLTPVLGLPDMEAYPL
jgi:hypothetical protein